MLSARKPCAFLLTLGAGACLTLGSRTASSRSGSSEPSSAAAAPRRVVLVTGGSRGIGKTISEGFAARGDLVVINYRSDRQSAERTLAGLAGSGHTLAPCDVADAASCAAMVAQVAKRHGRLDVLVNNAAVYGETPPLTSPLDQWEKSWSRHLAVNVMGPAALSWAAANVMAKQPEGGAIVNVSSRGAKRGEPDAAAYGAAAADTGDVLMILCLVCLDWAASHFSVVAQARPRRR